MSLHHGCLESAVLLDWLPRPRNTSDILTTVAVVVVVVVYGTKKEKKAGPDAMLLFSIPWFHTRENYSYAPLVKEQRPPLRSPVNAQKVAALPKSKYCAQVVPVYTRECNHTHRKKIMDGKASYKRHCRSHHSSQWQWSNEDTSSFHSSS